MMQKIATDNAPAAIGPYSQGVKTGGFVFVSGQIPLLPGNGEIAEGGIESQTRQCLENLKAVLAAAGCTLDDVVKTTVFIKDMGSFAKINSIYAQYFTGKVLPARACVEVAALPKDVLIEIEAIARCAENQHDS